MAKDHRKTKAKSAIEAKAMKATKPQSRSPSTSSSKKSKEVKFTQLVSDSEKEEAVPPKTPQLVVSPTDDQDSTGSSELAQRNTGPNKSPKRAPAQTAGSARVADRRNSRNKATS